MSQSDSQSKDQRSVLTREFVLVTCGEDHEIDAVGIILDVVKALTKDEIRRALTYIADRYEVKL